MKKLFPIMLAVALMLSCSVTAFAAKDDGAKAAKAETESTKAVKVDKAETNYREAIAAAEAVALEAAGVDRAEAKYVDAHVEYTRGVATAIHVEIGVYTRGVGTERSSYLIDIDTLEILGSVEIGA